MTGVPKSHPRYHSLMTRKKITQGVEKGITSIHGLIAQGRGEAFDYLIGESTFPFAEEAIDAAIATLLLSDNPVISINGNACALAGRELVLLGKAVNAPLEVNIFHPSKTRERKIRDELRKLGAKEVLLPSPHCALPGLMSNRRLIHPLGMEKADVVLVPLEDGDRTKALADNGKKVVTIDLNPFSRTAQTATITIVDNITRACPALLSRLRKLKTLDRIHLSNIIQRYDNKSVLKKAIAHIHRRLKEHLE